MSSILQTTKKVCQIDPSYTVFDDDFIMHINGALAKLNQLGVGPEEGFEIVDDTATWEQFIGVNKRYNGVKNFVQLSVKLLFDPPSTSYLLAAYEKQIDEWAWRLNVVRESTDWVDPEYAVPYDVILDGGTP